MHGSTLISKGHRYPKYFCSTYARGGKNNPYGCGCHAAGQDALVNVLIRKFHESVLSTENVQRFRRILRQQLEGNKEGGSQRLAALRKQIADLDREIDRAAENFLRAPTDLLDLIGEKLTALKRQREYLRSELAAAKSAAKPNEIDSEVDAVVGRLRRLGEEMAKAEPARRREVFRLLFERIDLRFDHVPMGKKTACPLQSGAIHLRTGAGTIFGSVSRGDRI